MENMLNNISSIAGGVIDFQITSFDGEPFTVRTVVLVMLFLVLGYLFSKKLSSYVAEKLLPRFEVGDGEKASFRILIFYVTLVLWSIIVLNFANIPLTIFTFLGGMFAIGIGFGSKNIMNNFISGLIILLERPIRVGDTIEIEGKTGKITDIGARSTKILLRNNTDLIVPNSILLEKTVTNLTLSDKMIRSQLTITVEYDSDVEQVRTLLLQAADSISGVLKKPAPLVIVSDLGIFGIVFDVFIWTMQIPEISRAVVESKLRCSIYNLLNKNGIKFARTTKYSST